MFQTATIKLLRQLQEEGYTMLVSKRCAGRETGVYFPERGNEQDIADNIYSLPLHEDQAIAIADALRWLNDYELKQICVTISA